MPLRAILLRSAAVIFSAAMLFAGNCALADSDDDDSRSFGLWGDLPYDTVQAAAVPALIADMNAQHLMFSVHDGDLKSGGAPFKCDDALYTRSRDMFNTLTAPAMFTPGDNDWTDCDRPANGLKWTPPLGPQGPVS